MGKNCMSATVTLLSNPSCGPLNSLEVYYIIICAPHTPPAPVPVTIQVCFKTVRILSNCKSYRNSY